MSKFNNFPKEPESKELNNAYHVLCRTHETCSSFLDIYDASLTGKQQTEEVTYQEHDLLRAMLIFSTAGLDATVKQLIRDALPEVIKRDVGAEAVFRNHIEKKLTKAGQLNIPMLAKAISSGDSLRSLLEDTVRDLTSTSLQSKDEVLKTASYFNIASSQLTTDFNLLKSVFDIRNEITHEMDIDLTQNNHRRPRSRDQMVSYTNEVLRIAHEFLIQVDNRLMS